MFKVGTLLANGYGPRSILTQTPSQSHSLWRNGRKVNTGAAKTCVITSTPTLWSQNTPGEPGLCQRVCVYVYERALYLYVCPGPCTYVCANVSIGVCVCAFALGHISVNLSWPLCVCVRMCAHVQAQVYAQPCPCVHLCSGCDLQTLWELTDKQLGPAWAGGGSCPSRVPATDA